MRELKADHEIVRAAITCLMRCHQGIPQLRDPRFVLIDDFCETQRVRIVPLPYLCFLL